MIGVQIGTAVLTSQFIFAQAMPFISMQSLSTVHIFVQHLLNIDV